MSYLYGFDRVRDQVTAAERSVIDEWIAQRGVTVLPIGVVTPDEPSKKRKRQRGKRNSVGSCLNSRERKIKRDGGLLGV